MYVECTDWRGMEFVSSNPGEGKIERFDCKMAA